MKNLKNTKLLFEAQGAVFSESTLTISHKGRARQIEQIEYKAPQGGKGAYHNSLKDFADQYNQASKQAAIEAIEAEIASEIEAERTREENRMLAEAETEKQRQEAEKALKAEYEEQLEAEREKLAEYEAARASKKNKATKGVMIIALALMFMASSVTMFLNIHNLDKLLGAILPFAILVVFAMFLSFMPIIYAWFKNKIKVEAATIIGPIDVVVAVLLYYLLGTDSFLYETEWMVNNKNIIQFIASLLGSIFYAYQLYLTFNELYAILSDKKYEEFFNKLFE